LIANPFFLGVSVLLRVQGLRVLRVMHLHLIANPFFLGVSVLLRVQGLRVLRIMDLHLIICTNAITF
jgi:hypothetical protein